MIQHGGLFGVQPDRISLMLETSSLNIVSSLD